MAVTERRLFLIDALNRRGVRGKEVNWLLRHFSQEHIARQIDYYDSETLPLLSKGVPRWAAWPWLCWRIRRNLPAPDGFMPTLGEVEGYLRLLADERGTR